MKIALPVDENKIESTVCVSFGRAPFFMVYDTQTKQHEFIDNSLAAASQGGAGIKAAQLVADQQVEVLITPRCGENAAEVFSAAGIKLYKSVSTSIQETVAAFENNQLAPLTELHAGFHGHGGQ